MIAETKPLGGDRLVTYGAIVLVALYLFRYLGFPDLPGNVSANPMGWWGWFDQSKTLESAHAFAHGDLSAGHHWYPLGYALTGALFERLMPMHAFFAVNVASLLAVYWAFLAVCRRLAISTGWSIVIFYLAVAVDYQLFAQWIIPWNTTPVAALMWLLLANVAAYWDGERRPLLIGLLAGAVPVFRPVELAVVAPCLLAVLVIAVRRGWTWRSDVLRIAIGFSLPVTCYLLAHLCIYGPQASDYMRLSRGLGFSAHGLVWKAYVILVEPRAWFHGGEGLLHHVPWMALGIAGLILAFVRGGLRLILAVVVLCHAVTYLCYVDFLPSGLWRYYLVHYWTWVLPAYGALGFLLLRELARPVTASERRLAGVALAVTVAILCVEIKPVPATSRTAFAVDFSGPPPAFSSGYFDPWQLRDDTGILRNVGDVRGSAAPFGLRVFSIRSQFSGDVSWVEDHPFPAAVSAHPVARWDAVPRLGYPCWVPFLHCAYSGTDARFLAPFPDKS